MKTIKIEVTKDELTKIVWALSAFQEEHEKMCMHSNSSASEIEKFLTPYKTVKEKAQDALRFFDRYDDFLRFLDA